MPNAKVLSEKQAIVAGLTEKVQNAAAGVIVDYKGITVAEDTALRAECRQNNIEYAVVKNTLLRFAFHNVGMTELDEQLNGTTSMAICMDDPVAPARVIADFAKKVEEFTGNEITVEFDQPTPLQIDGETILDVTSYTAKSAVKSAVKEAVPA